MFIIVLMLGMFLVIVIMLVFVVRAMHPGSCSPRRILH